MKLHQNHTGLELKSCFSPCWCEVAANVALALLETSVSDSGPRLYSMLVGLEVKLNKFMCVKYFAICLSHHGLKAKEA